MEFERDHSTTTSDLTGGATGDCDLAELCTGTSGACPADVFEPAGTLCGSGNDTECDNPDTCKGGEDTCLPNWETNTHPCTGASQGGECDNNEADHCTGNSDACVDVFDDDQTVCRGVGV